MLPHPLLFFKVGFAVNGELLTPDDALAAGENQARVGLYAGDKLDRIKLTKSPFYPRKLESRLDFFASDLGDTNRMDVTWQTKLYFQIIPMNHVTASHPLYVFDTANESVSVANDATLGRDVRWDYTHMSQ